MTENHRVLTTTAGARWAKLSAYPGLGRAPDAARVLAHGERGSCYQDRTWLAERRREGLSIEAIAAEADCSYHTVESGFESTVSSSPRAERTFQPGNVPWNKDKPGYRPIPSFRTSTARLSGRARSGERSNFWRGGVASVANMPAGLGAGRQGSRPVRLHLSGMQRGRGSPPRPPHRPRWRDARHGARVGNLITLCATCHRKSIARRRPSWRSPSVPSTVWASRRMSFRRHGGSS